MKIVNVIREIHQGGFGVVHEVELENGDRVARKTFNPLGKDKLSKETLDDLISRFSREVKTQERLSSDFFIPIIHSSLGGNEPWFLMPLADDVFSKEIAKAKSENRIPEGLADILNSLEYLHERGYKHRDLKPGNVLYHDGRWRLADFGLITADPNLTKSYSTADGFYAGSEYYMAPEQHTNFGSVTHHADIYSFGAILHDIFVGKKRIPYKKLTGEGKIGLIIEKCTEEDINRRFSDIDALRSVLLSELNNKDKGAIKKITTDTTEWLKEVKDVKNWNSDKFDSFVIYLDSSQEAKEVILWEVTSTIIEILHELNTYVWKRFIQIYFKWIFERSFDFDYSDVIISHIYKAYSITNDLEIKADAPIISAKLGSSHNRWYVMRYVLKMCNHNISDMLAERIAIEIHVGGRNYKNNFKTCVRQINLEIDRYHPVIKKALKK